MATIEPGSLFPARRPILSPKHHAEVVITPPVLELEPGQTAEISLIFTPPRSDERLLPVYSGWIEFESDLEVLRVPYLGLAASLKKKQIFDDRSDAFGVDLPILIDPVGSYDFPTLIWR
jgi:hypothetical protein